MSDLLDEIASFENMKDLLETKYLGKWVIFQMKSLSEILNLSKMQLPRLYRVSVEVHILSEK